MIDVNDPYAELDLDALPLDDKRGTLAMKLFIVTEASLFVCFFFAYFYIGHAHPPWPPEAPKLKMPLIMLGVLLSSSVVVHLAEKALHKGKPALARGLVALTMLLGCTFIALQMGEYADRLHTLQPQTNAYGSLFYAITGFHGLHVLLGLCMLGFVLVLPRLEPRQWPPHKPLHNASLYWHFVDVVWVVIIILVYLFPQAGQ